MSKNIFEKVRDRELPAEFLYEDEDLFAIKDIYPKAPVHILIIPKKYIPGLQALEASDYPILIKVVKVAQKLAKEYKVEKGYRLLTNNGKDAGQTVFHLHFHLLGGKIYESDM